MDRENNSKSPFQLTNTFPSQGSFDVEETDPWREERLSPLESRRSAQLEQFIQSNSILTQDMLLKSLNEHEKSFLNNLSHSDANDIEPLPSTSTTLHQSQYDTVNSSPDISHRGDESQFNLADSFSPLPANNIISPNINPVKQDLAYNHETTQAASSSSDEKSYIKGTTKSEAISNIQNVFTDSQKVAYVGLCFLHIDQWRRNRFKHASKKVISLYDAWSVQLMEKLYIYLDLLPEERSMIRSLAEHGLLPSDLTAGILKDVKDAATKLEKQQEREQIVKSTSQDHDPAKDGNQKSGPLSPKADPTSLSDIRYTILSHLFVLCIADGFYDAWSRTLLRAIAKDFEVELHDLARLEQLIADQLRVGDGSEMVKPDQELIGNRNKIDGQNRWLLAGLATVAGGAVIGLTAGLAAPLIGAGIGAALSTFGVTGAAGVGTFMAGTGGLAIITTGGVLTGGGMSGFKMMKRTRGIEEFEFLGLQEALKIIEQNRQKRHEERRKRRKRLAKLEQDEKASRKEAASGTQSMQRTFSASASSINKHPDLGALPISSADPNKSSQMDLVWDISSPIIGDETGGPHSSNLASLSAKNKSTASIASGTTSLNMDTPKSSYLKSPIEPSETFETEKGSLGMESGKSRETSVLITIAGWLAHGKDDYTFPFSTLTPGLNGDQYSLLWESQVLTELGSALSIIVGEIASFIFQQGLQATLLPMLMAGLTGPMWMIKLTYLVDNPWGNALTKAEKAGRVLADTLIGQVQSNRPVTLVGFSLGARVIYFCLAELASRNASGLVEEVYMFGTPVMSSQKEWQKLATVVSNRIVNGYTSNDTMLGVLYRASSALWNDVAGLRPVDNVPGIENMDLTDLVAGHLEYRTKMPKILQRCGFAIDSDTFEDLDAEEEKAKQELELEKKMEKEAREREKAAEKRRKQEDTEKKKRAKEAEAMRKKMEKGSSNTRVTSSTVPTTPSLGKGHSTPSLAFATTEDLVQDELNQMSQLEEMMQDYWQPREIKSTLPPLVIDTPVRRNEPVLGDHTRATSVNTNLSASELDRIDHELSAEMNEMGQYDVDTHTNDLDNQNSNGLGISRTSTTSPSLSTESSSGVLRPPQASYSGGGLSIPPRSYSSRR